MSLAVSASDGNGSATYAVTRPPGRPPDRAGNQGQTGFAANTTHALMASNSGAAITLTAARYGTVNVSGTAVTWVSGTMFPGIMPGSPMQSQARFTPLPPSRARRSSPSPRPRQAPPAQLMSRPAAAATAT